MSPRPSAADRSRPGKAGGRAIRASRFGAPRLPTPGSPATTHVQPCPARRRPHTRGRRSSRRRSPRPAPGRTRSPNPTDTVVAPDAPPHPHTSNTRFPDRRRPRRTVIRSRERASGRGRWSASPGRRGADHPAKPPPRSLVSLQPRMPDGDRRTQRRGGRAAADAASLLGRPAAARAPHPTTRSHGTRPTSSRTVGQPRRDLRS